MKLENWTLSGNRLVGNVLDHPRLEDGSTLSTAPIKMLDFEHKIAVTVDGRFHLGEEAARSVITDPFWNISDYKPVC